jgi:hypothetical protein
MWDVIKKYGEWTRQYYINFKVHLVTFKVVPFAIHDEDTR